MRSIDEIENVSYHLSRVGKKLFILTLFLYSSHLLSTPYLIITHQILFLFTTLFKHH